MAHYPRRSLPDSGFSFPKVPRVRIDARSQDGKEAGLRGATRDMDGKITSGIDKTGKRVSFPQAPAVTPAVAASENGAGSPAKPSVGQTAPAAKAAPGSADEDAAAFAGGGSGASAPAPAVATGGAAGNSGAGPSTAGGSGFPPVLSPGIKTGNPGVTFKSADERLAGMNADAAARAGAVKTQADQVQAAATAAEPKIATAVDAGGVARLSLDTPKGSLAFSTSVPGQNAPGMAGNFPRAPYFADEKGQRFGPATPLPRIADETGDRTAEMAQAASAAPAGYPKRPKSVVGQGAGYAMNDDEE